jgi:hypothetical protein
MLSFVEQQQQVTNLFFASAVTTASWLFFRAVPTAMFFIALWR